ncbi:MYCBP-associated protein-like [Patiria miniata]|uniref:MYCBP-associated protein n=1 Tax=Patiria miniata TaxID=46514 RepID=A0A914BS50_PATMI|nr:MYCBP-associated protein-like [Patiria miniata]
MSSRLSTKPSRKDRPRSSDKLKAGRKRDGTPEKPVSPNQSQSQMEEDIVPVSKKILDGEDIRALAIDHQELAKIRATKQLSASYSKEIVSNKVTVRKLQPQAESDKPRTKNILIAKPAPPNASLKQEDFTGCVGPRFNNDGGIIPHSILGKVEDFKLEAVKHGHFETKIDSIPIRPKTPSLKYEKKQKNEPKPRDPFLDENNALVNWQLKMIERKKQQGFISKLLEKPVSSLVMNHGDDYRKVQEDRYLIERSIPAVDYGRGYRIGSEFWNQQERIGDDISGIHMTLTETERGYPPPIEHVGQPAAVKMEMGAKLDSSRPGTPVSYPWHQSKYLKERRQQLNKVMQNLDPYIPELNKLQIIGRSNPYELQMDKPSCENKIPETTGLNPDVNPASLDNEVNDKGHTLGPSLQFDNFMAAWSGDSHSNKGLVAHGARVTFEVYAGERITSYLNLVNKGTTTVYYDWKKIPKINPFEGCASPKVQHFYFNTSSGVLLPGESLKFPFVFKSPNAGIFSETWQLDTRPVLCGGAVLQVTLRGIALQEDKNKRQRYQIEQDLFTKQAVLTAQRILDELIDGIRTPERPCSPVDAYITQEELFQQHNKGMHYSNEIVNQLSQLYLEQFDDDDKENHSWDLSIHSMKQDFLALEDETKREDLLTKMNAAVTCLYFPPLSPIQQEMYRVGYQLLIEAADNIVTLSSVIRDHLGLPTKDVEMPDTDQILGSNDNLRGGEIKKKKKEHKEEEVKKDGKKDNKKGKKEEKERDRPKSKGGKTKSRSATSPPATREPKRGAEKKQIHAPVRSLTPPSESGDPHLDAKYRNKMYIQVYGLLSSTIDKMTELFHDIQPRE